MRNKRKNPQIYHGIKALGFSNRQLAFCCRRNPSCQNPPPMLKPLQDLSSSSPISFPQIQVKKQESVLSWFIAPIIHQIHQIHQIALNPLLLCIYQPNNSPNTLPVTQNFLKVTKLGRSVDRKVSILRRQIFLGSFKIIGPAEI